MLTDYYYGNFSVFQSLPDLWAIDQIFPVMPIHRLKEKPTRNAVLSDITCDSDGKIAKFAHSRTSISRSLPLHDPDFENGEDYMLGIFLVGAYQETLGDLHNLLGDTNVVSVRIENGKVKYSNELEGDSVSEVLTYVEYDPKDMVTRFRNLAESAVVSKRITATERREIMGCLRGRSARLHLLRELAATRPASHDYSFLVIRNATPTLPPPCLWSQTTASWQ
jgi:arginine decarboxylase